MGAYAGGTARVSKCRVSVRPRPRHVNFNSVPDNAPNDFACVAPPVATQASFYTVPRPGLLGWAWLSSDFRPAIFIQASSGASLPPQRTTPQAGPRWFCAAMAFFGIDLPAFGGSLPPSPTRQPGPIMWQAAARVSMAAGREPTISAPVRWLDVRSVTPKPEGRL